MTSPKKHVTAPAFRVALEARLKIFAMEKGHTSYTSNLGLLSMRQEVCKYVDKNYKVKYNPVNECIITVGVSEALDLIFRAIITPGDEIIYHEPCYVSYSPEIRMAHGVPVVASRAGGLVEAVEDGVSGLLAGNTPAEIGRAIVLLLGDDELRGQMGRQQALQHQADFTVSGRAQ